MMPFGVTVQCSNKHAFPVSGVLESNVSLSTGAGNAIAYDAIQVGTVLTTEGPKRDIKFTAICPICGTKENYQALG
ncbi:hypothetical protein J32TS2_28020 [Shouchella clausii]|uniref:hypothetical protein n=1 Tax=Shouchella clausii TaxID=79880 RepID=UPI001B2645D9|nr:hypothetical protein [Shouchella clausii]GIN17446.1 hypothetical protein J32TS2_28020 [Shouchella clausii]